MKGITVEQILRLHKKMADVTGGAEGIRNIDLLESALNNAYATFDGDELYPDVEDKAASTCFSIISNHPFIDGNKRMGIYVMLILLELNEIKIVFNQNELVSLGLGIAEGRLKQPDIRNWIQEHRTKK